MTSTNTFTSLEKDGKPSSRVLKPPGGGSSCIFGNSEEVSAPKRQGKMSSNIFEAPPEAGNVPKRSNPPGGKTSGIFQDPAPVHSPARQNPPGGKVSGIFSEAQLPTSPKAHPNKPKDNISLKEETVKSPAPVPAVKADPPALAPEAKIPVAKEEKVSVPDPALAAHEPHLGPRPRCHNRVLNPPGGKSSVTFY
ncbi:jupiter microtubule associated homolog 2 isoform 1-T1 [Anomaloglossus baeobatrachus]|uniref:jupiter microtubule associated homolog 2 isoform X1 n=1 Tax=Anomaloglossus baeobatrachus TaxID=238106 RepID=UPI003F4FB184